MKKYKRNKMTNTASWLTLIAFIAFNVAPFPGYAAVTQSIGNDGQVIYTTDSDTVLDVENFDQSAGAKWVFDLGHGNLMVNVNGDRATTWAGKTDIMGGILGVFNRLGFHIASTAEINLQNAGFIGAAMRLTDQSFSKQLKLQGDSDGGYLLNEGKIHGGNVALLGRAVENKGSVEAPLNQVTLAGGQAMTVGLSSDNLISVVVDEATDAKVKDFTGNDLADQIKNSGNIRAHKIKLDAKSVKDVFRKAINLFGEVEATDVKFGADGVVELVAQGDIESTGKLQASKITMDATGAISSMGILHAKELYEKGASFAIGGTFDVGQSYHDNLDHAITYAADTHVSGAINDAVDIVINAGVTITLDNDTTFTADSDTNGTGHFLMDSTSSIIGNGKNLTIKASQNSTVGNISDVNIFDLRESQGSSNPTFTSDPTVATWSGITDFRITSGKLNRFTGSGTSNNPYLIYDVYGLQAMNGFLASNFKLANDITATSTLGWNAGSGFNPIGAVFNFTGSFNGAGHTIADLFIYRPATSDVGLFGASGAGATINNVGLLNANITGLDYVGGISGWSGIGGGITNDYVEGSITGRSYVGGLVGYNNSRTITNSHSTALVTGSSDSVGGLVGGTLGDITNSYATGHVIGSGNYTGGLAGNTSLGSISNSYATGAVNGAAYSGGLVGINNSSITNSYATGHVIGSGNYVGGLVGVTFGDIAGSYATGVVDGASSYVGGLAGYSQNADISSSHALGAVTGVGNLVGGLVGYLYTGSAVNTYASGVVQGNGNVGGLIGASVGIVTNSYASGAVNGSLNVGGLEGANAGGSITNSFATGVATSSGNTPGGLVGSNSSGTITNSWWYNGTNAFGIGNTSTIGNKANAKSDFYSSSHPVYTGASPWDFTNTWSAPAGNLPGLQISVIASPQTPASSKPIVSAQTLAFIDGLLSKIISSQGSSSNSLVKQNDPLSLLDKMLMNLKQALAELNQSTNQKTTNTAPVDVAIFKADPLARIFQISTAFAEDMSASVQVAAGKASLSPSPSVSDSLKTNVAASSNSGAAVNQSAPKAAASNNAKRPTNPVKTGGPSGVKNGGGSSGSNDDQKKKKKIDEAASASRPIQEFTSRLMDLLDGKSVGRAEAVQSGVTNFNVDMKDVFKGQDRGIEDFRAMLFNTQSAPLSERGDHPEPTVDTQMMLTKVVGQVKVIAVDGKIYNAEANKVLKRGDQIWTGSESEAQLKPVTGGETVTVRADAMVNLDKETLGATEKLKALPAPTDLLTLAFGRMSIEIAHTRKESTFRVQTPTGISGVRS